MHASPRSRLPRQYLRAPVVPLGMDQWGQFGYLYEYAGIDVDEIVNAAMLALELNEG